MTQGVRDAPRGDCVTPPPAGTPKSGPGATPGATNSPAWSPSAGTQEVRYAYGASDRSFIVPPASRLAGLARHYSAAARDLQFARHQLSAVDDRRPADAADAIMAVIERLSLAAAGFAALAEADEA